MQVVRVRGKKMDFVMFLQKLALQAPENISCRCENIQSSFPALKESSVESFL